MKTTISYANSPCPNFDAMQDIHAYLGDRYEKVEEIVKGITDARSFTTACSFLGIEGLPVKAWFDHYHGEGAYDRAWPSLD